MDKRNFSILLKWIILPVTILLAPGAIPGQAAVIEHEIEFKSSNIQFSYDGDYAVIKVEGLDNTDEPGNPSLPYIITNLLMPSEEGVDSILISADYREIPGMFLVKYAENPIKTSALEPRPEKAVPNHWIYESPEKFPGRNYELIQDGRLGPNHIIALKVFPVVYYPALRKLKAADRIRISVYTGISSSAVDDLVYGARAVPDGILADIVDNYPTASHYARSEPNRFLSTPPVGLPEIDGILGYEYVVITSEELAGSFDRLVEWKKRKGLLAGIVTREEIEDTYSGVDVPEKIRNYLREAYQFGLKWVLLGGDEIVMPVRYAYPYNTSRTPELKYQQICDLYFSDLTGVWEVDGDGVWGEWGNDDPDIYPEIFVGRLPAATAEEIEAYTDKLLTYEQNPGNGNYSYLTGAVFIAADELVNGNQHVYLGNQMPANFYVDTTSLAERPSGNSQNPTSPTGQQVIDKISEGFGFISNLNHGSPINYAVMTVGYNQPDKSYVDSDQYFGGDRAPFTFLEENYKYGVHYSISCSVSAIDHDQGVYPWTPPTPTCLGEAYVEIENKGGVAFLGNSRWGWVSTSYLLETAFIHCVFGDDPLQRHVGAAEAFSKVMCPAYRDIDYGHNLYGDPEFIVWDRIPRNILVEYTPTILATSGSYLVSVSDGNDPLENMKVCLYKEEDIFAVGYTDPTGDVVFEIDPSSDGFMHLTVTGDGYIPYLAEIALLPLTGTGDDESSLPYEFSLMGNYPNPFNSSTSIKYSLDESGRTCLDIYDIAGRLVNSEETGIQEAGIHELRWQAVNSRGDELASGVYFYRLTAGDNTACSKMILVK